MEKEIKLVNLTPHPITIRCSDGSDLVIVPSGVLARCEEIVENQTEILYETGVHIELVKKLYANVYGLPQPKPNVLYIVSWIVAKLTPDRNDLVYPGSPIRDEQGKIIACEGLSYLQKQEPRLNVMERIKSVCKDWEEADEWNISDYAVECMCDICKLLERK